MACMLGTYATASVITAGHLGSDEWAEKVSFGLTDRSALKAWVHIPETVMVIALEAADMVAINVACIYTFSPGR